MEFVIAGNQSRPSCYIAVYPVGMRAFSIVISRHAEAESEPEITMRQVDGEEALFRLLIMEGVAEQEIRECFSAKPPRTRTIITASALSALLWFLIGGALLLLTDWL